MDRRARPASPPPPSAATTAETLAATLAEAMAADERIVLLGGSALADGGLHGASAGLLRLFGDRRVLVMPDDEAGMIGAALGLASTGLRPVVDLELADHALAAYDVIVQEIASARWRRGGGGFPLTIRMPSGGGVRGGPDASAACEAAFCQIPGLRVLSLAGPDVAAAMLMAALRFDDPVLLFEPKALYHARSSEAVAVDGRRVRTLREGGDATVLAHGAMVEVARAAAESAADDGIEAAVVDLVSLSPLDEEGILAAAAATGRAIVVHEGPRSFGVGAEVAALLAERAIERLEAPVLRVAAPDVPTHATLESRLRPDAERVRRAIEQVVDF